MNGIIDKEGHVTDLPVVAGPPMLQQPAIDAVSRWTYKPFTQNGQPVEVETDINVIFKLGDQRR